jgi:hypothetical protein
MSDPRFTDQRSTDPRSTDFIQPAPLRDESVGGIWGWVAGLAVVALIAFVVVAGWNNSSTDNAAITSPPAPITTGNSGPVRNVTPPSTTGSGSTSPLTNPATPNPAAPNAAPPANTPQQQ